MESNKLDLDLEIESIEDDWRNYTIIESDGSFPIRDVKVDQITEQVQNDLLLEEIKNMDEEPDRCDECFGQRHYADLFEETYLMW